MERRTDNTQNTRLTSRTSRTTRTSAANRPTVRRDARSTRVVRGNAPHGKGEHAAPANGAGSRGIVIALIAIVVVAAVVIAAFTMIGQPGNTTEPEGSSVSDAAANGQASSESLPSASSEASAEPDEKALNKLLGKETAKKLIDQAKTNEDAAWIASHVDSYASEGDEVQVKILKLAAEEPKALPYVRLFATDYPEKKANTGREPIVPESDFKGTEFATKVPHFFQWDNRWGQTVYSSTTFGLTGCGPTSMSMVYQAITGKNDGNPSDMAKLAEEGGYMAQFDGTGSGFFFYVAAQNDFSCTELDVSGPSIVSALESGKIVIANLAEGFFTEHGHFFVLTGLDKDGKVIINDPYSYERSTQTWDADFIAAESMALFAFSNDPYPWG